MPNKNTLTSVYQVAGNDICFDGFENFSEEQLLQICMDLETKYTDFNDIVLSTYENMRSSMQESGKSKLYCCITETTIKLNTPIFRDNGTLRISALLMCDGKGKNYYWHGMGHFNINSQKYNQILDI